MLGKPTFRTARCSESDESYLFEQLAGPNPMKAAFLNSSLVRTRQKLPFRTARWSESDESCVFEQLAAGDRMLRFVRE
jgi:hypothetical protein